MKKIHGNWIYPLILMALLLMLINACEKEDPNPTNGKTTAVFNNGLSYGTMTDQDGNVYKTITIGDQTWMAENLRTTKYRDGSPVPEITGKEDWTNLTSGAYCNFSTVNNAVGIATYGRLYNWYAVSDTRNLAPTGWHVPTDAEWSQLTDNLGEKPAGKLKETGTTHWANPSTAVTNETGFTALPGGIRDANGHFSLIEDFGYWWSASDKHINYAWSNSIAVNQVQRNISQKKSGFSIRCVKD